MIVMIHENTNSKTKKKKTALNSACKMARKISQWKKRVECIVIKWYGWLILQWWNDAIISSVAIHSYIDFPFSIA